MSMKYEPVRGARRVSAAPSPVFTLLPACLWGIFFLALLWQTLVAAQIFFNPRLSTAVNAIRVHLPRIDQFGAWIVVLIWMMGQDHASGGVGSLKQQRVAIVRGVAAAAGICLAAGAMAWDQFLRGAGTAGGAGGILAWLGENLGMFADVILVLLGLAAALRELKEIAGRLARGGGGVTVVELWRLASVQWMLAWVGAMTKIWWQFKDDLARNVDLRDFLYILPAVGLLPNILMLTGIHTWNRLAFSQPLKGESGKPRTFGNVRARAWLLAVLAGNLGSILLVIHGPTALPVIGAVLMLFAVIMYLAGFPRGAWRDLGNVGGMIAAAWAIFLAGILLLPAEYIFTEMLAHAYFSEAWRHLLGVGCPAAWLMAMAAAVQSPAALTFKSLAGNRRWMMIALATLLAGIALTAGLLILASTRQGDDQVPIIQWLAFGPAMELAAVMLVGMLLWRWLRVTR